jgi:hypothetical protein
MRVVDYNERSRWKNNRLDRFEIETGRKVIQTRRNCQEFRFSSERRRGPIKEADRTAAVRMAQPTAK